MLSKTRRSAKLFSDFNTLQFASVMSMIVFVLLLLFMLVPTPHRSISVDEPAALHPISMPKAAREDAMRITVTRDGRIYFRAEQALNSADLQHKVTDYLKDPGVERKVYIAADMRTKWVNIKTVLDDVRSAGIVQVAFLVNPRRIAPL